MRGWAGKNIRRNVNRNRIKKIQQQKKNNESFVKRMEKAKKIKAELHKIFESFVNTNDNNYNFKKIINNQQYEQILLILQLIENKHTLNNSKLKDNWIKNGIVVFIEVIYNEYGQEEFDIGKDSIIKPFLRWYTNVYQHTSNYNHQNNLITTKYNNILLKDNKEYINSINLIDALEIIKNKFPCGCPKTCKNCKNSDLISKLRQLNRCIICDPFKYIPCLGFTCNCLIKTKIKYRFNPLLSSNPPLGICTNHLKYYALCFKNIPKNPKISFYFLNKLNQKRLNYVEEFTRINIIHARTKQEISYYQKTSEIDKSIKNWFKEGSIFICADEHSIKFWPAMNLINNYNFNNINLTIYKFTYKIENDEELMDTDDNNNTEYIVKNIIQSKYNHKKKYREWNIKWEDDTTSWETQYYLSNNAKFNEFNSKNKLTFKNKKTYDEIHDQEILYNAFPCCLDIENETKNEELSQQRINLSQKETPCHVVMILNIKKLIIIFDPNKVNELESTKFKEHFKNHFLNETHKDIELNIIWKGLNINNNYKQNIKNVDEETDGICDTLISYILYHIAKNYTLINQNAHILQADQFINYIIKGIESICKCLQHGIKNDLFTYNHK